MFRQRSSTSRIQNYLSKLDQGNVEEWEEYEVEIELMTKSFVQILKDVDPQMKLLGIQVI